MISKTLKPSKIQILIERFFIISSLIILISTFGVGIWFNQYEQEEKQKENLQKIHEILSHLLIPSLTISDFSAVKRLLYMASDNEVTFLILDNEKTIIKSKDENDNLSKFVKNNYKENNCNGLKTTYKIIAGNKFLIFCSKMKDPNLLSQNQNLGLLLSFTNYHLIPFSNIIIYLIVFLVLLFTFLIILFRKMLYHRIIKPIMTLKDRLHEISMSSILIDPNIKNIKNAPEEIIAIKEAFEKLLLNLQEEYVKRIHAEKEQTLIDLSKQLAHDIRSPLSAINTGLASIKNGVQENIRVMIKNAAKRINDIANNMLFQYRNESPLPKNDTQISPELMFVVIDYLLAEKRFEHSKATIVFDTSEESFGCFAEIHLASFKRVLSNLINNSIDAIPSSSDGKITIYLNSNSQNIEISITDNGCGIPPDMLPKISDRGFSFGKKIGAGLGLFYSKQYIESLNGMFIIESEMNVGTQVKLVLPRCKAPNWFCENLSIKDFSTIVVLDDDPSIHAAWKEKFSSVSDITIYDYFNSNDMISNSAEMDKTKLFLIDYELIGNGSNGLEVIEQNKLNLKSILVTSCFEDPSVRSKCAFLGIKIIPKNYVPYIPIHLITKKTYQVECVFIDDDEMMRLAWSFAAEDAGTILHTFASPADFEKQIHNFKKNTIIYIDSNLRANLKGEHYAKYLYEFGFTNIYLATGNDSNDFGEMPWIKKILGKEPNFDQDNFFYD